MITAMPSNAILVCRRSVSAAFNCACRGLSGKCLARNPMVANCTTISGNMNFQNRLRRMIPLAAYPIENTPMSTTDNASRTVDQRPMLMTSFANPIPANTKNTAARKMILVQRGMVRHGMAAVIEIRDVLLNATECAAVICQSTMLASLGLYSADFGPPEMQHHELSIAPEDHIDERVR